MSRSRVVKRRLRTIRIAVISLFISVAVCCFLAKLYVNAQGNRNEVSEDFKYYKSIQIQEGDTLWNIAESYMSNGYSSVNEYIKEIQSINHLKGSDIYVGQYLTIVYSDLEFK